METNENPLEPQVNVKPLHIQPVPTSGGQDLVKDLVWQRDPDCSVDPVVSNPVLVSQGVPVNQAPVDYPSTTATQGLHQHTTNYQYQAPHPGFPSSTGDHVPGSMVQTFQVPQGQNVVTFMPVTNQQAVIMDTDGNRIQSPMMQQGVPGSGYPITQNMVPVQFSPTGNFQYINMPSPSTTVQQSPQNFSYPRLIPFNPQTMTLPQSNSHHTSPQSAPRPRSLNVTVANQAAQKNISSTMSSAGTQVSSPVLVSPSVQSPSVTSPGTESVKSPTYVFMCNKCNYVTPHRSSFKTHYSSHMQYKPYQCAYCNHATIMKQPMQKHIKLKHAIEDAEGFTYESDSKKEKIIDFHCNQCRSTMSVEEAKNFLAKYESHEKLKPGPAKRKGNKEGDDKDDESITPSKKKKRFSWSETDDAEQNDEHENPSKTHDSNSPKRNKLPISPRKLTHWKQDVTFKSQTSGSECKKKGRPKKGFVGKPKKFLGFGKTNKFSSPVSNLKTVICPYCEFRSGAQKGLKKHCEWRHPGNKIKCTKCTYSTFFKEEMDNHLEQNQCDNFTNIASKHERSKSPEKTVGRPRKSLSTEGVNKTKSTVFPEGLSEENSDESGSDDIQLNCPHCNFISNLLALKRHLFFYHKECDWRCKNCGFISSSKKEVVRHSNKSHPDVQPNIVQTFADISSLLPDTASEQEKLTPPNKDIDENDMDSRRLIDRDFIKTSKKRLVLGKKRVSKIVNSGQLHLGTDEKLQVTKVTGTEKKRGRKKEGKVNDQNSFVVRPKKLRVAEIGFSCVYCTYAAPLRHQLRLHCYEKHTKHPACLMEFVNSKMAEDVCFPRDMAEDKIYHDGMTVTETETRDNTEKGMGNPELKIATDQPDSVVDMKKSSDKTSEYSVGQSAKEFTSTEDTQTKSEDTNMEIEFAHKVASENSGMSQKGLEGKINAKQSGIDENVIESNSEKQISTNENQSSEAEENQNEDVLSCMQNILAKIGHSEDGCSASVNKKGAPDSSNLNYMLPHNQNKMNGHKFSNPFSTLIVQVNSTQIKVKDAFEGTLDDVDIYLEKFGVRTLNMDSLTPRQFAVFMKKFGSHLQPLT